MTAEQVGWSFHQKVCNSLIKFIPRLTKIKKVYFNSFYNELLATCIECGAKCEDAKQKIKDILNSNDVTNTIRGFDLLYSVWWFESLYSLNTNFHGFPCQVHPPEQMFIALWMHLLMIFSSFFQAVEDDDANTGGRWFNTKTHWGTQFLRIRLNIVQFH